MSADAVARLGCVADVAATLHAPALGLEVVRGLGIPGQVLVRSTGPEAAVRQYLGARADIVSFAINATVSVAATDHVDGLAGLLRGASNS